MHIAKPLDEILEKEWQHMVVGTPADPGPVRMFGFHVYHTLRSKGSQPGYPDWTIARERVIWLELKRERTHCTPAQIEWLKRLVAAGAEVYVPRPRNFDALGQVLAHRGRPDPSKNHYARELLDELEKEMTRQ